MSRIAILVAVFVAALFTAAAASATVPQVRICYENSDGQCVGADGWYVQTTSSDACGGLELWASKTGQYSGVWVDDTYGSKRQSIINCEHYFGKPWYRIFVGLWEYEKTLPHFNGAENIAEYYPYHSKTESVRSWWGCPNQYHPIDGFLTQWFFAFHNDTPPTAHERDSEWWTAISCIPPYGWWSGKLVRAVEPMGVY